MKRNYMEPEMAVIEIVPAVDILAASNDEVFVDGGDLFNE